MSLESILREVELYRGAIDRDEMRAWYTDRIVDLHLPAAEHEAAIKTLCERLGY